MNKLKKLLFTAISAVITGFVALATDTPLGVETPMTGGWMRMVQTDSGTDLVLCYTDTAAAGFTWTVPSDVSAIDYLVVGGGGSGGSQTRGGGGGAGGLVTNALKGVSVGNVFSIYVGAGGPIQTSTKAGNNGSDSTLACEALDFVMKGLGGGGGGYNSGTSAGQYAKAGGSGGGAAGQSKAAANGGAATQPESVYGGLGNPGGNKTYAAAQYKGGSGGGGAGGAGIGLTTSSATGRAGGPGVMSTITGEEKWYAGGGGGGGSSGGGAGGSGVGGAGGTGAGNPGVDGTGSGGGGAGETSKSSYVGGKGGDGAVIIRYTMPTSDFVPVNVDEDANVACELSVLGESVANGGAVYKYLPVVVVATPRVGYEFVSVPEGWTFMADTRSLTREFTAGDESFEIVIPAAPATTYEFTLTQSVRGTVTADQASGTLGSGQFITLTATANTGFYFAGWLINGEKAGWLQSEFTIMMDEDKAVEPVFYLMDATHGYDFVADGDTVLVFTNTEEAISYAIPTGVSSIRYLVVGGGGSGGAPNGGGGGAGGLLAADNYAVTAGNTLTIHVGAGGAAVLGNKTGGSNNGKDSSITNGTTEVALAYGGGGGGYGRTGRTASPNYVDAQSGGSGGGCHGSYGDSSATFDPGALPIDPAQGNAGGTCTGSDARYINGGGGGGAGSVGGNGICGSTAKAGDGGAGLQCDITGENLWYAAGGGGACYDKTGTKVGLGGSGIGGKGCSSNAGALIAGSGVDGTGSGGGGAGYMSSSSFPTSGKGGDGIVILRYLLISGDPVLVAVDCDEDKLDCELIGIDTPVSGNYVESNSTVRVTATPKFDFEYLAVPDGWTLLDTGAIRRDFVADVDPLAIQVPDPTAKPRATVELRYHDTRVDCTATTGGRPIGDDAAIGAEIDVTAVALPGYEYTTAPAGWERDGNVISRVFTVDVDPFVIVVPDPSLVSPIIDDYVQDGLVAMWDCADSGHVTSTGWTDRSGCYTFMWEDASKVNYDSPLTNGISFTSADGGYGRLANADSDATFGQAINGTVEFVVKDMPSDENQFIFENNLEMAAFYWNKDDKGLFGQIPSGTTPKCTHFLPTPGVHTFAFNYSNQSWVKEAYIDGTQGSPGSYGETFGRNDSPYAYLGRRSNEDKYTESGFKGKIYAIRIYSRRLSAEEIQRNSNVDASRFARFTIETDCSPSAGGTVTGGGEFVRGESVTLQATAASGFVFLGWTGDVDGLSEAQLGNPTLVFQADRDRRLVAVFGDNTLLIRGSLDGTATTMGTVTPAYGEVVAGERMQVSAERFHENAAAGVVYECVGYQLDGGPTIPSLEAELQLSRDVSHVLCWQWRAAGYRLSFTTGSARGTTVLGDTVSGYDGYLMAGRSVTVRAPLATEPTDGIRHRLADPNQEAQTFLMDAPKTVHIEWVCECLVSAQPNYVQGGTVTVTGDGGADGWFMTNSAVTVSAVASSGYSFSRWEGDVPSGQSATSPTLNFTVTDPCSLTAVFTGGPSAYECEITASVSPEIQTLLGGVSETDVQVPVRLSTAISGFSYGDFVLPNGGDLIATDMSDNELPLEVATWNPLGESVVWVRLPTLSSSTQFKLKYRGPARTVSESSVWSNHVGVWHMDETITEADAPAAVSHSSTGSYDATPMHGGSGNLSQMVSASGVVGNCRVNASSETHVSGGNYLSVPNYNAAGCGGVFTFSAWVRSSADADSAYPRIVSRKSNYKDSDGWEVQISASNTNLAARGSSETAVSAIVPSCLNDWVHFTFVYNNTSLTVYTNGYQAASGPVNVATDNNLPLSFGRNPGCSLSGKFDELRLRKGALAASRVALDYALMHEARPIALSDASIAVADYIQVLGDPYNYAADEVYYGITNCPVGTDCTFESVASVSLNAEGTERAVCTGWEVRVGGAVVSSGSGQTATVRMDGRKQLVWKWRHEVMIEVHTDSCTVTGDGGWQEVGKSAQIVAMPNSGCSFFVWKGDTEGVDSIYEVTAITFTVDRPRKLTAVAVSGNVCVWTAPNMTKNAEYAFDTSTYWRDSNVPSTRNDAVIIKLPSQAFKATLKVETAFDLGALVVGAGNGAGTVELRFDNGISANKVAGDVRILAGGSIAHKTNGNGSKDYKLNLSVGGDMIVDLNASVNAKGRGYGGSVSRPGLGHGSSHGGRGSVRDNSPASDAKCVGSIFEPLQIGAGSSSYTSDDGYYGGGAIQLSVAGELVNNGTITADAATSGSHNWGASGSIWIECARLVGSGGITAATRTKYYDPGSYYGGGGGRIAIYETVANDWSAFDGKISTIYDRSYAYSTGGTIYRETAADGYHAGEILVEIGRSSNYFADFPANDGDMSTAYARATLVLGGADASGKIVLDTNQNTHWTEGDTVVLGDLVIANSKSKVTLNGSKIVIRGGQHRDGKGWTGCTSYADALSKGLVVPGGTEDDPGSITWRVKGSSFSVK